MSAWKLLRVYQSAGGVFIPPVSFAIVFQVCYRDRLSTVAVSYDGVCLMNSAGNCYFWAIQDRMDSMKRFYRYIIYRLYDKALKKPSFTPVVDTITPFAILHMLIFFVVAHVFCMLVIHGPLPLLEHMGLMIFFVIFNLWVHYILFYDKKAWNSIMEEFKDESPAERRKGGWCVVGYLVGGSLFCFALFIVVVFIGVELHFTP